MSSKRRLSPRQPLPDNWWRDYSDEELGWYLVTAFMGMQAEKEGVPTNPVPPEWAERFIERLAAVDTNSVENAPLESACRKACAGDLKTAGRMFREHVRKSAENYVWRKWGRTGMKVGVPMKQERDKRSRQANADATEWQREAVKIWTKNKQMSASDVAKRIDSNRWNTIRRKIRKP